MIMRKPFLLIASEETVEGIKKYRDGKKTIRKGEEEKEEYRKTLINLSISS